MAAVDPAALDPFLAARCLIAAGLIAYHAGQLAESDRSFTQAVACARKAGRLPTLAFAICRYGQTLRGLGETDRADAMMRELRQLAPELSDHAVRFAAYNELGAQGLFRHDLEQAWADFQQALASARALGYPGAEGVVLHFLGYVSAQRGDLDLARDAFHRARAIQETSVETERLSTLHGLGRVECMARRPAEAARWLGESLDGRYRRGERLQARLCLIDLGLLALQIGEADMAARWFGAADVNERIAGPRRFFVEYWIAAVDAVRASLGERAYEQAYRRGQLDSLDRAVEEALRIAAPLSLDAVTLDLPI
jgi:tetratricopeptide (TPR) repeat protein